MNPVFSPENGQIDAGRLRIVFDDINPIDGYIDDIVASIKKWESALPGIEIVNLNPGRGAQSSDYTICVGNGARSIEPNKSLRISYVAPEGGYFFSSDADKEHTAIHEFGHLMGLADRYYEGYQYDDRKVAGNRTSIPMSTFVFKDKNGNMEKGEEDYDPKTNVMSSLSKNWTISRRQRELILLGEEEVQRRNDVVGVFYSKETDGTFAAPDSMFLDGDRLYELPGHPKAGYRTLLNGLVCIALADKPARGEVRELWRLRGSPTKRKRKRRKISRKGKVHRGPRVSSYEEVPGERIHRKVMSDIGRLVGG